ncbi:PCNA-interacting partner-like [Pollicipes pollicipes]|uniref:PCNA-interacting partner-like n=1 Tax=Pollicipes pollicipes TaxID=41117 RepID=UPI0018851B6A|nr:PCNA-interacting partner-like [Pollicipes pollicipes]
MPMYQTVVSHVRRVELGGQNYQPAADCPLHASTPALRGLVHLVHKLHDVLEEEPDPRKCCLRLLSAIKSCVLKGSRLRPALVERVTAELRQTVERVCSDYGQQPDPAVIGGPPVKAVRDLCDRLSCSSPPVVDHLSVLEDAVGSPTTPGRTPLALPSVVSLFRTPVELDEDSGDVTGLSLEERLRKKGVARTETPTTSKRLVLAAAFTAASRGRACLDGVVVG